MNKRALAASLLLALVGVGLIHLYMTQFELEVTGGTPVPVLFVRKEVLPGSILTEDALGTRSVPQRYLSPRQILASDLPRVIGTRVSSGVNVNDGLLWSDLALIREDRALADLVQDGMRAVSLRTSGFDGLLRPGDRVDVLFLAQTGDSMNRDTRAVTILQNILVLSVGGYMQRELPQEAKGSQTSVSLLLTVEQAELAKVSEKEGDLELVLRNAEDVEIAEEVSAASSEDIRDPARRARFLAAHDLTAKSDEEGSSDVQ